jgi:heat shock protein HtpX
MVLTLFLLGLVYAVLVGVLFAAGAGAVLIAVIAGALFLVQFFTSDKIALASMGAH